MNTKTGLQKTTNRLFFRYKVLEFHSPLQLIILNRAGVFNFFTLATYMKIAPDTSACSDIVGAVVIDGIKLMLNRNAIRIPDLFFFFPQTEKKKIFDSKEKNFHEVEKFGKLRHQLVRP